MERLRSPLGHFVRGEALIQFSEQLLGSHGGERGKKAREPRPSSDRAPPKATGGRPQSSTQVVHHRRYHRPRRDAAGHKSRQSDTNSGAQAQPVEGHSRGGLPPRMVRKIAIQGGACSRKRAAGDQTRPAGHDQKQTATDADVIQELGDVGAMQG